MEQQCPKKLLDQARHFIRLKHYSYRTEQAYVGRIKRYIYFHDARHPSEMGAPEAAAFVIHLLLKWQEERAGKWRCDSPITLFEVAPVQSAATEWTYRYQTLVLPRLGFESAKDSIMETWLSAGMMPFVLPCSMRRRLTQG